MTLERRLAETVAPYADDAAEAEALIQAALRRAAWRQARGGKVCSRCGVSKMLLDFGPDDRRTDGHRSACRRCEAEAARSRRRVV